MLQHPPSLVAEPLNSVILNPFSFKLSQFQFKTIALIPCFNKMLAANLARPPVLQLTIKSESG